MEMEKVMAAQEESAGVAAVVGPEKLTGLCDVFLWTPSFSGTCMVVSCGLRTAGTHVLASCFRGAQCISLVYFGEITPFDVRVWG